MADEKKYVPLMQSLIRHVLRKFYEPHHCVIMDILLEHMLLKESELCANLKMLGREFNRLVIKLREDKLIKQESKIETGVDGRQLLTQCYFIDYREVKDIIKYKIYKMSNIITKRENQDISDVNISYKCNNCEIKYSILEVQSLMKNYQFICPDCSAVLVENKDENSLELHSIMMNDLQEIIEMLKKADSLDIPTMDYFQVLEMKKRRDIDINSKKSQEKNILPDKSYEMPEKSEKDESTSIFSQFETVGIMNEENTFTFIKENSQNEENFSPTTEIINNNQNNNTKHLVNEKKEKEWFVKVNGIEKLFSSITEEDQEKMTEQEYEEYFEIYAKQNE